MTARPALVLTLLGLFCLSLGFQVNNRHLQMRVLAAETERAQEQLRLRRLHDYWLQIVTDSPTYRDGYVQLAVIAYLQGQTASSHEWLTKAEDLDPNYVLPPTLTFLHSQPVQ